MSPNENPSEEKENPETQEKTQTAELKNILQEMDDEGVPKLKIGASGVKTQQPFLNKGADLTLETAVQSSARILPEDQVQLTPDQILKDEKPTGDFFADTEIFFKQLGRAYKGRYELWESTSVAIMKVLKKMRQYNEVQSGLVINTIEEIEDKLMKGLKSFEMKRNEIERYAGIEYKLIIKGFKKTLDLLQFQIKQLKLQNEINELYKIFAR